MYDKSHGLYCEIQKIVIKDLKEDAKKWANYSLIQYGDAHLTKKQLLKEKESRKRLRKAARMLLKALKTLKY